MNRKLLIINLQNWIQKPFTSHLRGTQIMYQVQAYLHELQGSKTPPDTNELMNAGLLHQWLENPDNTHPLQEWLKAQPA